MSKNRGQNVFNDLLPGIVSVGLSICVFLYAWISDVRQIQRLETMEPPETEPLFGLPPRLDRD
jgi:hypothetical protein